MHEIRSKQKLPITLQQGWEFLSSPYNLKKITPPYMGFDILSGFDGEKMYPGMIINYIVRPLFGLPMNWTTEITHVVEPHYFVDEQRFGPYAFWHHKHFLKEIDGGVEMEDIVHYKVPFGPVGKIVNALVVRKKVEEIFRYREKVLKEMFGEFPEK